LRRNEEKDNEVVIQEKEEGSLPSAGILGRKSLGEMAMASLASAADKASDVRRGSLRKTPGGKPMLQSALQLGGTTGRAIQALKTPIGQRTVQQLKLITRITTAAKFFMALDACAAHARRAHLSLRHHAHPSAQRSTARHSTHARADGR
jgi:hypothetical protein